MLSAHAKRLLNEALALPDEERIELAEELVQAAPLGPEWLKELDERGRELDDATVQPVPAGEAHARLRAELDELLRR